jgi:Tol biopolymer transport system component
MERSIRFQSSRSSLPFLLMAVLSALVAFHTSVAAYPSAGELAGSGSARAEVAEETGEVRFLQGVRQITYEGRRAGEGYFNSDGSMMVFQSEREPKNPFYQIYLLDLESGDTRRISPGSGKTTCAWIHPTQEKVLFASTHQDPEATTKQEEELEMRVSGKERRYSWDYDETYDIFECGFDGENRNNLTNARGYDAEGSWSPDGKWIAFSSNRHAYTEELSPEDAATFAVDKSFMLDIYLMRADGSAVKRLTDVKGYDGGPFFSPDGERICWRRFSEDGSTAEVWTMNIDGTDQKQITHLGAMSWAPYYHPSGDYLIFTTNIHGFGNFELYLVDVEGKSEPVRVTTTDGFDGLPVFHPEGEVLSWTSNRTANDTSQIFFAKWNDAEAREALGLPEASSSGGDSKELAEAGSTESAFQAIEETDLKTHLEFLASEELEGRLTGSPGELMATRYVSTVLKGLGLEPAGEDGTFFQKFEFTAGVSLGEGNRLTLQPAEGEGTSLKVDEEYRPLAFSRTGEIEAAPIVFAGYGITAPAEEGFEEYDSFVHLDVKDKWVMVFRFMPEDIPAAERQHFLRYSSIRYKAMVLRGKGAKGVLYVSGPTSQVKNELLDLQPDASLAGSGIAAIALTDKTAQSLLDHAGKDLKELQTQLDSGDPMMGFDLPDIQLAASIDIKNETQTGRNVLARLPASAPTQETVLIGAHIDHLGRGYGTNSLARAEDEGKVHYGADDNASGVSALLEVAEAMVAARDSNPETQTRDLMFAAWSGEELGLIGSNHFVKEVSEQVKDATRINPPIAAYLNMDMVGRLQDNLVIQGYGSSPIWPSVLEKANLPIGLSITTSNDSYLPTDATSFYLKGVPILAAFTGTHSEYHTPRDVPDLINWEGLKDISELMARVAWDLATRTEAPPYVEVEKPENMEQRAAMRAYLGTIPDYSQGDVSGVALSGVAKGGPADKAGVQSGDVIVGLAGQSIQNIYDYTFAIEALKIGQTVEIQVQRGEEKIDLEITPESRQ